MKELIRQQGQCVTYAKEAAKNLSAFFKKFENDEGLFFVSFSHEKEFGAITPEPNAATSIISGVITSLNAERASALCDKDAWTPLEEQVNNAIKCVVNSQLKDALPLKTMGKLPLHSTAHLTQLLLCHGDVNSLITTSDLLAICIRRLIVALELDFAADNLNSRERLHPYHIYVATHVLCDLVEHNNRDKKPEYKRLYGKLNDFKNKMDACESTLIDTIIAKLGLDAKDHSAAKLDLEFGCDNNEWTKLSSSIDDNYFTQLFLRIEERAVVQAQAQIANKASSVSPDFDPSSLTFAIATLSELRTERYRHIVMHGLDILFQVFEEEDFASTIPFMVDDKGRAAFVPSVETANALLKVCEEQLKESRSTELERAADVAQRFQKRLERTRQNVTYNGKKISGWCSDKAPSKGRIDSWVTAYALEFFYRSHEIVKLEKRRKIFENYSWRSYEACKPKWDDIVDPNCKKLGDGSTVEPIKAEIMSLIDSPDKKRLAPVFLLYGPPGTSKTSFVNGVAQAKKWDLILLSPSDFISDSVDKIEHRARQIFHDLMHIDECVILFDEMDSLLLDRDGKAKDDNVLKFVVPAFLPKLQDLHDHVAKNQMAVFFVTNYAERIDSAIKRKGRIDKKTLIPPYNITAREDLLRKLLIDVIKIKPEIVDHGQNSPAIKSALGKMSPMSVYREMLEFAYSLKEKNGLLTLDDEQADSIYVDGLSIPPKTYDFMLRGDGAAKDEFFDILERVVEGTSLTRDNWITLTNDKAKQWKDIEKSFNCEKDFLKWKSLIVRYLKPD